MKKLSLAEIKTLDSGDIISAFEGEITQVGDQVTGEGDYGTWWAQNLKLTDGHEEIYAAWAGEDPFDKNAKGQTYLFESVATEKHGKQGLKWTIKTSKGKTYKNIKITPTAKVTRIKGDSRAEEPPSERSDAKVVSPPRADAKTILAKCKEAYGLCIEAGEQIRAAHTITPEHFQAMVSSFFIKLDRANGVDSIEIAQKHDDPNEIPF